MVRKEGKVSKKNNNFLSQILNRGCQGGRHHKGGVLAGYLIESVFAPPERPVGAGLGDPGPVVREEDEQGVPPHAGLLQGGRHLPDLVALV